MTNLDLRFIETEWGGVHVVTSSCLSDFKSATGRLKMIVNDCRKKGANRVLCECSGSTSIMNLIRLYQTARYLQEYGAAGFWIAFVMHGFSGNSKSDLFETFAINRSINVRFFSGLDDAVNWLKIDQ